VKVDKKHSLDIGRLRPETFLYRGINPDDMTAEAISRHDLRQRSDAVIIVGTKSESSASEKIDEGVLPYGSV